MNRKPLVLILALLAAPSIGFTAVLTSGSFEDGYKPFVSNYGGTEIVVDSTAPNGTHSLRFNFRTGCCDGAAPDIVTPNPEFWPDEEEIYVQFYLKYSSNWVDQAATNKWVYIWFGDTLNKPNLPIMGHSQRYPKGSWAVLQAPPTDPAYYEQIWVSNKDFTYGVWHKMVIRVKMNTPGVANGILQMWQDDVLVLNASNGFFRKSGEKFGITSFQMTPVYGGGGSTPPADQYMWFDDVIVQTTPFGASSAIQPSSPFKLSIN